MPLTDTFTDVAGTTIASHISDSGHSWTKHASYAGAGVISNANRLRSSIASNGLHYSSWTPATAEYDVQADIVAVTAAGNSPGVAGRIVTGANTLYLLFWSNGAGAWRLSKFVNATQTVLGDFPAFPGAGTTNTIKLELRDGLKTAYLDGVSILTSNDNTITGAGKAGVFTQNATTTDTTGRHFDNLTATDPPAAAYTLTAAAGSHALTGIAAGLRVGRKVIAAAGVVALTGQAAGLKRTGRLTAASGSFTHNGQAAGLLVGRQVAAGSGAVTLIGQDATLQVGRGLAAGPGAFTLSGAAAALRSTRILAAVGAELALSGQAVHFQHAAESGPGAFTLTTAAAGLRAARLLTAASGAVALTGGAAALSRGRRLLVGPGAFALSGSAAALLAARRLAGDPEALTLTGYPATLRLTLVTGRPTCYGGSVTVRTAYGGTVTIRLRYGGTIDIRTRYGGTARICGDE